MVAGVRDWLLLLLLQRSQVSRRARQVLRCNALKPLNALANFSRCKEK
jgi:hypothetical protein